MAVFGKRIFNVFNAYFRVNGVTLLANENLTSTTITREVQEAIIRNGIGGKVYSKLEYQPSLKVELGTNVSSFEQIAMACGSAIISGSVEDYTMAKTYTPSGDAITLSPLPVAEEKLELVDLTTDEVIPESNYTVLSGVVTFGSLKTPKGDVKVLPYKTLVATADKIEISSEKFSEAGELILKTYAVDEKAKITDEITIYIPKAKPSSNFTIATASDVSNGNDNTVTVEALDDNGIFGEIIMKPVVA